MYCNISKTKKKFLWSFFFFAISFLSPSLTFAEIEDKLQVSSEILVDLSSFSEQSKSIYINHIFSEPENLWQKIAKTLLEKDYIKKFQLLKIDDGYILSLFPIVKEETSEGSHFHWSESLLREVEKTRPPIHFIKECFWENTDINKCSSSAIGYGFKGEDILCLVKESPKLELRCRLGNIYGHRISKAWKERKSFATDIYSFFDGIKEMEPLLKSYFYNPFHVFSDATVLGFFWDTQHFTCAFEHSTKIEDSIEKAIPFEALLSLKENNLDKQELDRFYVFSWLKKIGFSDREIRPLQEKLGISGTRLVMSFLLPWNGNLSVEKLLSSAFQPKLDFQTKASSSTSTKSFIPPPTPYWSYAKLALGFSFLATTIASGITMAKLGESPTNFSANYAVPSILFSSTAMAAPLLLTASFFEIYSHRGQRRNLLQYRTTKGLYISLLIAAALGTTIAGSLAASNPTNSTEQNTASIIFASIGGTSTLLTGILPMWHLFRKEE